MAHREVPRAQQGIVLAMALIMLALLSILAGISIRGASSTEQVANQSRLKALAQQTAEAALRFCEQQVQSNAATPGLGLTPEDAPTGAPYSWELMDNWDTVPSPHLQMVSVRAAGDTEASAYFTRPAECMSQYLDTGHKVFVTTARGFGPEVAARKDNDKTPPKGTEIWLQSVVTLE
jgi:type IV pilus assembly protein PilX